ncbi:MAG: PAS domain S-box protein, partial [Balneolaceae bacterium]|nr:PAS domain S-box protein [Balneolaceae bacterium]
EQELAYNKNRMESILETAVEGIVTIDTNGIIRSFNSSAEEIFGYESGEVIGESVNILMPAPYSHEHDDYMQNYLRTGEKKIIGIGREVRGRRKDGSIFPMELSVSEVKLGGELFFTGFIRDISERRELENEILRISEEERHRIGRDLHDGLGQMLTGIGLISQNLARKQKANGLPGADEVEELSEMIREADEQAKALARDQVTVELESETFTESVRHMCRRARRLFNIECRVEIEEGIELNDSMTKLHLYRIIQEAVNNAVKHGKASEVDVHFQRTGDYVTLKIVDNGIGFEESLKRNEEEGKGKGMGMSTMDYRAHMLGGNLNVEQTEEGETMIVCTIPDIEFKDNEKQ